MEGSRAGEGALDTEDPVEVQSNTKEASRHERHNEAHDWTLTRRILVAGIICLST